MDKKHLRFLSLILFFLGIFFLLNSKTDITGAVIGLPDISSGFSSILGIVFIFVSLILFMTNRSDLETKIDVYDDGIDRKNKERNLAQHYFMSDYNGDFHINRAPISLGEFERQINSYRNEGEEEFVEIIEDQNSPALHRIVERGGNKVEIARAFLKVLEGEVERNYRLNTVERREIREPFRTYDGDITRDITKIFKKYNIDYEIRHGGHYKFKQPGGGVSVTASRTPSDIKTGLNIATEIIKMIEKNHENQFKDD